MKTSIGTYTGLASGGRQLAYTCQHVLFYPNTYLNFNANGEYTKHYYNGNERIASRLGENTIDITLNNTNSVQFYNAIAEEHFRADVRQLIDADAPVDMPPLMDVNTLQATGTPNDIFYYHTNHLGSTAFVTDNNATVTQGFLYAPFGEITTEFNATFGNDIIPQYSFNAKELDEETGMYYYEARYYAPPVFVSRDPMFEQKPWLSPYHYCSNNPTNKVDPTGRFDIETGTIEKGDNLTKITKQINEKFGTKLSISDIAKANNIEDANKIQVGNKITLPGQNAELKFDLKSLKVTDATYGIDMPGLSWDATSGRDGFQCPEFQNIENKGPIPEGNYIVNPAMTQSILCDLKVYSKWEGGCWSQGGKSEWGTIRTWLKPMEGTNTYGRSGFSIHGGKTPGSAGCIDLTNKNNQFHTWLKSYGKPIKLNVNYH